MKTYREGAIGALLDEYERAITDLKVIIKTIDDNNLITIVDTETADEDCRSIQTILSHVVHSGYGYAVNIHNQKGHNMVRPPKTYHTTVNEYIDDLAALFLFTEKVFKEFKDTEIEELNNDLKIKTGWGQLFDVEQMTEHAIVHILRHRRQIEKIKLTKLN
jgi:uncharacterized damage-inducible protein DinB